MKQRKRLLARLAMAAVLAGFNFGALGDRFAVDGALEITFTATCGQPLPCGVEIVAK